MTEQQDTIVVNHDGLKGPVRIAINRVAASSGNYPGLFWLGGFKSVMTGGKATHIAHWAAAHGIGVTRFDYSGHGESSGQFADGTISRWLAEAKAVLATATGPQILVGSSMGGYLALLLARSMSPHPAGVVLLAPAVDMTERLMWSRFPEAVKQQIKREGVYLRQSAYGDGDYAITRALIDDGRQHLLGQDPIRLACPVRIVHGMQDPDVPWQMSQELLTQIEDDDIVLHLVKDGEHRLSRPQDLQRLQSILSALTGLADSG